MMAVYIGVCLKTGRVSQYRQLLFFFSNQPGQLGGCFLLFQILSPKSFHLRCYDAAALVKQFPELRPIVFAGLLSFGLMLAQSPEVLNGCFFGLSGLHPGLHFLVKVNYPRLPVGGEVFCQCFRLSWLDYAWLPPHGTPPEKLNT